MVRSATNEVAGMGKELTHFARWRSLNATDGSRIPAQMQPNLRLGLCALLSFFFGLFCGYGKQPKPRTKPLKSWHSQPAIMNAPTPKFTREQLENYLVLLNRELQSADMR